MRIIKQLSMLLMPLTLALTILFVLPSYASAYASCIGSSVCLYQNSNFGGTKLEVNVSGVSFPFCYNLTDTTGMNDQASSVVNDTFHYITYFRDSNCTGYYYMNDNPSSHRTNLAYDVWAPDYYYGANDQISSFEVWP